MPELSNGKVHIVIAEKGAELQSIVRTDLQQEYLWSGDPAFWGKKSPVLFPVVGALKNSSYTHEGKNYTLGRHGFAREMIFTVTEQTADSITFSITDTADTMLVYPFRFRFSVRYTLQDTRLTVTYLTENTGDSTMFFSVGAHPAFKVPLTAGTSYDDYYLWFNKEENAGIWPLSEEGFIERTPKPYLGRSHKLPLHKSLFYKDALVFKNLSSTAITLKSDVTPHGVEMHFDNFPYMGLWAAKDADFVCIEPWCGIADNVDASGELSEKEGIHFLAPKEIFERQWRVNLF